MDSPCIKQTVCKVLKIFQCGKYLVAYVLNRPFFCDYGERVLTEISVNSIVRGLGSHTKYVLAELNMNFYRSVRTRIFPILPMHTKV